MTATRKEMDLVFAMDEAKEKDGVGIAYGKLVTKIARAGGSNKAFAVLWEEKTRPYKRLIENGIELPEDVAQDIVQGAYAEAIVRDWNLTEEDGTAVPCNTETVLAEFKRNPEYFRFVYQESQKSANYRRAVLEAEAKN